MEDLKLTGSAVIARMEDQIARWTASADQRSIFLSCYMLMTRNMETAIANREFLDPVWVSRLLGLFADYYFVALQAYEENPASAPLVWQVAHINALEPRVWVLQKLLLGVNAHINFDLVLTVSELLRPEWEQLSSAQQGERYTDFTYVNEIIGRTIDAVQDQIIEPVMPVMDLFDRLLGRGDELLISRLLAKWREQVWKYAMVMLQLETPDQSDRLVQEIETDCLGHARAILLTDLPSWLEKIV